jgi:hypothetical protein
VRESKNVPIYLFSYAQDCVMLNQIPAMVKMAAGSLVPAYQELEAAQVVQGAD